MDEYIKREFAIKYLLNDSPGQVSYSREDAADCISYMDAADVAPVRHGRWIWADDGYCRCSECKQKAPVIRQWDDEPMTTMTNYCPVCGARMDGGDPT